MKSLKRIFPLDKNYILKEAQLNLEEELLLFMVETVKKYYLLRHNPLDLEDDPVLKIKNTKTYDLSIFEDFYQNLCIIYRYQNPDNQLEMIFDGRSHLETFGQEWRDEFQTWIKQFCYCDNFLKAVLEAAIFRPGDNQSFLIFNRLRNFIFRFFEIKIYKYKGIKNLSIA